MLSQFVFVLKIKIKWSLWPFPLHEISVLIETILGHLRYLLTDVPPQPNSPPDGVCRADQQRESPPATLRLEPPGGYPGGLCFTA